MNTNFSMSRILKNTVSLYMRILFLTLISLYTVRIILQELGVEDYGVYNVVSGLISLLGFFAGTLSHMSQRFFSIYLAKRDWNVLQEIFSVNLSLNIIVALVLFMIAETGGVWFVLQYIHIPEGRQFAALLVYECSIITFLMGLMSSPFQAILFAEENMGIYSRIAIVEGILKLLMVYCLVESPGDKLITYALAVCIISLGTNGFYILYSRRLYSYARFSFCRKKSMWQDISAFVGWNFIGDLAVLLRSQGISILMNLFFGPMINASRGIALQVNNVIFSFIQNFMVAIDPQIMKSYSAKDFIKFKYLLIIASKISYFMGFLVICPLALNLKYVMILWLGQVPAYTDVFIILILIDTLLISSVDPILSGIQAIGNMRIYQCIVGGIALCNVPVAYIALCICPNPILPFVVGVFFSFCISVCQILVFRYLYSFSIIIYLQKVIIPVISVTVIAGGCGWYLFSEARTFAQLAMNCMNSTLVSIICIWALGMESHEKEFVKNIVRMKWTQWRSK